MDNGETETRIIQNLVTIRHDLVCLTWSEETRGFENSQNKPWIRKVNFTKIKQISFLNRLILMWLGLSGCHGLGVARLGCSHFNWLTASKYQDTSNSLQLESSPDTCAVRTSLGETPGTQEQEMTFWISVLCNPPQTEASKLSHTRTFRNGVEIQMRWRFR